MKKTFLIVSFCSVFFFGTYFFNLAKGVTYKEIVDFQKGKVLDSFTDSPSFNLFLTATPTPTPVVDSTQILNLNQIQSSKVRQITIRAKSSYSAGFAHMQLRLGDTLMQEWDLTGNYKLYVHDTEKNLNDSNLRIYFTNDHYKPNVSDRNLYVEYITVDGQKYLTSDSLVYSTGTWQAGSGCAPGYKQTIELDCNGYLEYPTALSAVNGTLSVPTPTLTPTPTPTTLTTATPTPTIIAAPSAEVIDTLSYFVSKNPSQSLTGTHALSQTITGKNIYYVKWANDSYEVYEYDNDYIYLKEDHSGSPVPGSYTYSDNRWLKRSMAVGDVIDAAANKIQFFTGTSCTSGGVLSFPYKTTLESRISNYDLGGSLGTRDVIVVRYDYLSTTGDYEKSYYSKDLGWVKWELYRDGKVIQSSVFNNISSQSPISPNLSISCLNKAASAPVATITPTPTPTTVVIVTPTPTPTQPQVPVVPVSQSALVSHLYSCVLKNSTPDKSGSDYWLGTLQNKSLTVPQLYTYFYSYQTGFTNEQFVTNLYNCVLFRAPDQGGYNYWLGILSSGQDSRANQVQYFLNSSGFTSDILPKLTQLK